jgi:hypothetical protein
MLFYLTREELYQWLSKCGPRVLTRGFARWFLSSTYKVEGKNIILNILNILQNLFIWNVVMTNILDSESHKAVYSSYIVVTQPFLWLND